MSLDVYVGTLTRYYSWHWKTTVQQRYAAEGMEVRVFRGDPSEATVDRMLAGVTTRDPEEVRPIILDWCRATEAALREHHGLEVAFDWDESMERPYFVDMPQRYCLESLGAWAEQHSEGDPNKYFAIRQRIDWWLPCLCPTFQWVNPYGAPVLIGSSGGLLVDLVGLNTATWNLDGETAAEWRRAGPPLGGSLEEEARFALSVMFPLTVASVQERLPMLLDE